MRVRSYSTVGVVEQKDMVNSGVRGTKDKNLRTEVDCRSRSIVPAICPAMWYIPTMFKYPVTSTGNLNYSL